MKRMKVASYSYWFYVHTNKGSYCTNFLFQVWNYREVSFTEIDTPRQFFMQHVKSNQQIVELGICERGPFGPVSIGEPPECSE